MVEETAVSQTGGTLLDKIVEFIIPTKVVLFLNTTLVRVPFFVLNYWSFVHFFEGILFYLLISRNIKLWFWLNVIFEIVEFVFAFGGNPLFVEEAVDIFWDILFGMIGFWLIQLIFPDLSKKPSLFSVLKDYIIKKINS